MLNVWKIIVPIFSVSADENQKGVIAIQRRFVEN